MIWVARKFSRAISMVKKPEVNPENKATTAVPMTAMATLTSTSEKAARRGQGPPLELVAKHFIFIKSADCGVFAFSRNSARDRVRANPSEKPHRQRSGRGERAFRLLRLQPAGRHRLDMRNGLSRSWADRAIVSSERRNPPLYAITDICREPTRKKYSGGGGFPELRPPGAALRRCRNET